MIVFLAAVYVTLFMECQVMISSQVRLVVT